MSGVSLTAEQWEEWNSWLATWRQVVDAGKDSPPTGWLYARAVILVGVGKELERLEGIEDAAIELADWEEGGGTLFGYEYNALRRKLGRSLQDECTEEGMSRYMEEKTRKAVAKAELDANG